MPSDHGPQRGLADTVQRETVLLAPYAMRSRDSLGRTHAEPEHPYRGPFQRDRDRILHSAAYRRLSGKMQVFTGEMGDYHRTRLTHTQEVASIARTIARGLRLNEDLVEALALFHDIGHPPFGHAGEDALSECLVNDGGFSHNEYALVIAETLETRYHSFPGLNLTREVLEGQFSRINHARPATCLLETQVVELADSVTYNAHDTDDALKLGLVELTQLTELPLIAATLDKSGTDLLTAPSRQIRKAMVYGLVDRQVSQLLQYNIRRLAEEDFSSAQDAGDASFQLQMDPDLAEPKRELEQFLFQSVYRHPRLLEVRAQAQNRLRTMFEGYVNNPDLLPARFQQRIGDVGIQRAVAEYLAGMTDRYCDQQFHIHFTRLT